MTFLNQCYFAQCQKELSSILQQALTDSDQWVATIATVLLPYPSTGRLNMDIEHTHPFLADILKDLRKTCEYNGTIHHSSVLTKMFFFSVCKINTPRKLWVGEFCHGSMVTNLHADCRIKQPIICFIIERTCVCSVHAQNNYALR